jgi:hypothetical protein
MHVVGRRALLVVGILAAILPSPADAEHALTDSVVLRAAEIDFASVPSLTRGVMRHELGSLLASVSLEVSWRRSAPDGETQPDELRVVLLRSAGAGTDRGALASARPRTLTAATIWVYLPTVARALGVELDSLITSPDSQRLVGLALGRVLAHEVVHVLAPELSHARAGVMRASLHPHVLTTGRASLDAECRAALASGARAWLARPRSGF